MNKKQTLCQALVYAEEYMDAKIVIPEGTTLHAGNVVKAEKIEPTLVGEGNYQTYVAEKPEATDDLAIVLNGSFERLSDGRRPNGNADYTTYEFIGGNGEVYTALRLVKKFPIQISEDAIELGGATPKAGDFLEANGHSLKLVTTKPTAKQFLEVKAVKYIQTGGQFGTGMTLGLVCMVQEN